MPTYEPFSRITIDVEDDQPHPYTPRVTPTAHRASTVRQLPWWVSVGLHAVLLVWLGMHGLPSTPGDVVPESIEAQLVQLPLQVQIPVPAEPEVINLPSDTQAALPADLPIETPSTEVAETASKPVTEVTSVTKETPVAEKTPDVAVPAFDFRQQQPLLLNNSPADPNTTNLDFSILSQQTLLSLSGQQQRAVAGEGAESFAQFTKAQISPTLLAGPEPLTKEEQFIKTYMQAKIDIDCASGLNQALVIISSFTVGALLCEDKGNVDQFIQQRLAEKKPPPPIRGMAQLKAIAHGQQ